jgi:hypothetical protein
MRNKQVKITLVRYVPDDLQRGLGCAETYRISRIVGSLTIDFGTARKFGAGDTLTPDEAASIVNAYEGVIVNA